MSDQPSWLVAEPYTDVDLRQEAVAGPLDRDRARGDVEAASQLADAFEQLLVGLRAITATGFAHGDLSAYNLLWWEERSWFIDFPQSIDIAANRQGLDPPPPRRARRRRLVRASRARCGCGGGVRRPAQLLIAGWSDGAQPATMRLTMPPLDTTYSSRSGPAARATRVSSRAISITRGSLGGAVGSSAQIWPLQ